MTSPLSPRRHRGASSLLGTLGIAAGLAGVIYLFRPDPKSGPRSQTVGVRILTDPAMAGLAALALENEVTSPPAGKSGTNLRLVVQPPRMQPAPEAVTRVFPTVTEVAADWREFRPESLTVAPYPDMPVKFTRTALRDEGRYVTWIGRNPDLPGASFVGVATARGYDAILVLPGVSQFSFHVRGEQVVMAEAAAGEESCGVDPIQPPKPAVPVSIGTIQAITHAPGHEPMPDSFAETAPLKVDVLAAYDADTLAAAKLKSSDPVGYIDGQTKAKLETGNLALSQSGVTAFAWRYLGLLAAPDYPKTGKSLADLEAMALGGPIADWVRTKRYEHGADQVLLWIGGESDFGGRAFAGKQKAVATADRASAVMKWGNSAYTLIHELAHNFGCHHDRAHYNVLSPGVYGDPVPDGDGFWCYGQLWINPPIPGGADPGTSGTIMSYADYRIPYFSNPGLSIHVTGLLVGWSWDPELGTHQTGRAESDPKAAYNVRVLNEQALAMSNISEEVVMPAITRQPSSISVNRGQNLQLGVTATGGGLTYEWQKGSAVIGGAISAIYSKTAEEADVGSYTVTIKNLAGTVTSDTVTVAVTLPPPPSPTTFTGVAGSGGGGGGAPSLWFLGLLGLASFGRWQAVRRN